MENFPFPFYVVLREINTLPIIMIEALKQWFEMVTKIEN
jgi:midasin